MAPYTSPEGYSIMHNKEQVLNSNYNRLEDIMSRNKPKVCIVGAGVTGLCACKHLLQHGVESVVLEAQAGVGGVWRNTFSTTKLQTPYNAFQFSDFLWPAGTPLLPSHHQVMDYLHSYARKFHVIQRSVFNCRVVEVRQLDVDGSSTGHQPPVSASQRLSAPHSRWAVCIRRGHQPEVEWFLFEHLMLCVGHYGDIPKIPSFPPSKGPEVFRGIVMHALDYSKLSEAQCKDLLTAKQVIVVGSRKSAFDLTIEAANYNRCCDGKQVTMLYRAPHWVIIHHNFYGIPMSYMTSRASQLLVRQPSGKSIVHSLVSATLSTFRWALGKALEHYLLSTLPLEKHDFVPQQNLYEEFKSCKLTLLSEGFFERVEAGHVKLQQTSSWCFYKEGVMLLNGDKLEADIVVLCTGYEGEKKLKSLLGMDFNELLQERDGSIPLYRGVLPPRIPNLAILGFQESYSNLFVSEMGARWVAHWIAGKIRVPSKEKMEKEALNWLLNTKPFMTSNDKTCVNSTILDLADQMCHDMGWNPKRKKSPFQEFFSPYSNMDYNDFNKSSQMFVKNH